MNFGLEIDLIKSRPHKYIKRTGTPGRYKYWYKLPDGRIVEGDEAQQKMGRYEHALRLLIAKKHGKHNLSTAQIAERTGFYRDIEADTDAKKKAKAIHRLNGAIEGFKKRAKVRTGNREDWHTHGHDWEESHFSTAHEEEKEAVAETASEAETPTDESITPERTGESAVPRTPRTTVLNGYRIEKVGRKYVVTNPDGQQLPHQYSTLKAAKDFVRGVGSAETPPRTAQDIFVWVEQRNKAREIEKLRNKLQQQFGISLDASEESSAVEEPVAISQSAEELPEAEIVEPEEQANQMAEASSPEAPIAQEVHSADPVLATDDEPIRRMITAQLSGRNPYLDRAVEIFNRVSSSLPEKNRKSIGYLLSTLMSTTGLSEGEIKNDYNNRLRNIPESMLTWSELKKALPTYKGVYFDLDEILQNAPLNPEVERMKRGYGRKQFERMKNYVKPAWKQANPDAPPPYPTFGDLQTWSEFGSRPSWASPRAVLAIPEEVANALPKDANGKLQLPPRWMPIHLMPIWNFAVKSSGRSDYQGTPREGEVTGSSVNFPSQGDLQSHILNAMRKYIQGRGGIEQLIDIPASKMTGNLSHQEIFKSMRFDPHDMSDLAIKKIIKHKIIDPIAIAPFIKEELSKTKKSFSLVIDSNLMPISFSVGENLIKSDSGREIKKSELIKKILEKKKTVKAIRIRG